MERKKGRERASNSRYNLSADWHVVDESKSKSQALEECAQKK
jgi:hypothetical protein